MALREDEEQRAIEFRSNQEAQRRSEIARNRALAAPNSNRVTNSVNWEPIVLARRESQGAGGRDGDNN